MATKFILVPEEIYNGLLRQPTTDDINLEYTRKQLDKIKGQNGNPEIKNNNYNQELRRYLHILNEKKNLPADVSVRHLETPALEQLKKLFPNTDNPSINIEKTKESELMAAIKSPLTDDHEESMYTAESSPELMEDTPRSSKTPTAKGSQKLIKIENIIKFHQDKFKVNEYGKIMHEKSHKEILGSNLHKSLDCLIRGNRWKEVTPPGTEILEKRLRKEPAIWSLIERKKNGTPNNVELILENLYNNPESPAGFSGVNQLLKEARKINKKIKRKDVIKYLEGHRTYTIHRPRRVRFKRSRTIPAGYMTDVQCDLADFQKLSRENGGNNYALVAIDVLSKRVFAAPVKSKKPKDMIPAFEKILEQMEMYPHRIFSDKGMEFRAKEMIDFFQKKDIEKYTANASTVKASLAERCIRNLKQRLYRYMSEKQSLKWAKVLNKIVDAINHSSCRVLGGLRPIDVSFHNAQKIRKKVFGPIIGPFNKKKPRFKKDDFVRMSRNKNIFSKGYLPNYSDEILQVDLVKNRVTPNRYRVRDENGEKFAGYFYPEELTKVRKDEQTSYRIEKVIRTRKRNGIKEYLIIQSLSGLTNHNFNVGDYPENRPNKFRSHLAKPIQFQGGNWVCGLYSIQYPQSWAATIGTDKKQWININYKDKKPLKLGIPKTTQLTPKGLSFFLKLTLAKARVKESRKRREIIEVNKDDLIIRPEINLLEDVTKKRFRREAINQAKNINDAHKQIWIEDFFDTYPNNYWEGIQKLENELEAHKTNVKEKSNELRDKTKADIKDTLQIQFEYLNKLVDQETQKITVLREEATKRDNLDETQIKYQLKKIANEFLEKHPDDYHEEIIVLEINILTKYVQLNNKRKEILEEEDESEKAKLEQKARKEINGIKRLRKKLEAIESVIFEKDLYTTRDEFHQQNSEAHNEYVQTFFKDHPKDHLLVLGKNLGDLKTLHEQIRKKRDTHLKEQDEEKRKNLTTELDQMSKLAEYRRNRFKTIQQEAYKRYLNHDLPSVPKNTEIKQMQKIEEKTHPEYLKHARRLDEDGNPIPVPAPVITEEMAAVVIDRHVVEESIKQRDKNTQEDKKNWKEEQIKHARKIDDNGEPITEEENKGDTEKNTLNLHHKKDNVQDVSINEQASINDMTILQTETKIDDLHSDIEFEYLENIDRFRAIFNDPEITSINISQQLCYVLGFPPSPVKNGQIGRYGIDLKGGFTSFAVYSKGLTSNVIMGNAVSSLLRIVSVENKSGGIIERVYDHPMFIPVLPREINEIEIELRWMNGSLVKFDHGTVTVTLIREVGYDDHHSSIQSGEGIQGGEQYHYFRGSQPFQRGYGRQIGGGIGAVLHNFWRFLLPYARRAGTAVAKEALDTGGRILESVNSETSDVSATKPNLKQTVIREGKRGIDRLLEKGGIPKQFGTGVKKIRKRAIKGSRKRKNNHSSFQTQNNHQLLVGKIPPTKKRQKIDTFGLY
ncbi:Integrase catalytic domain-containing protein [Meloidogyne graminicola]|uniref:Integrase catalytic domain-containing protein n=1 Tax=Meloidogyne graminicola TaxID=189291 RepID=A0A8S9ZSW3_9BILA|nr:Integrase catalytic domain-containing protein [Meloidogyne graminicola]